MAPVRKALTRGTEDFCHGVGEVCDRVGDYIYTSLGLMLNT